MRERHAIEEKYKWDTSHLFETKAAWEKCLQETSDKLEELSAYKGKLGEAETLASALELYYDLQVAVGALYLYAGLANDSDMRVAESNAALGLAAQLYAKFGAASSFLTPELIDLGPALEKLVEKLPELSHYGHMFHDLMRQQAHTLNKDQEEILASLGEVLGAPSDIFGKINNADMEFPDVMDAKGNAHKLSHGSAAVHLKSRDRVLRENTAKTMIQEYVAKKHAIAGTYVASLKKDAILAKLRGYKNSLEMSLFEDNIPVSVYENLIETVNENLDLLHRYSAIRQEALGLEEMWTYDSQVPLIDEEAKEISWEEAVQIVLRALEPLGEDYVAVLKEAFDGRWIDVYENEGKRSGAYSWGTHGGPHPYILMNWNGTIREVFTLAHEMGHALHSHLSKKNQSPVYSDYTIFLAEIASTVNESLLFDYLMKQAQTKNERIALLDARINGLIGTLFRQTAFAEFEQKAHQILADGGMPTGDLLNEIFQEIMVRHEGPRVKMLEESRYGWSRIPHFYRSFYVFQYATGISASIALSQGIIAKDETKTAAYLNMLASGSNDYSMELLKKAGVDLTMKEPIAAALKEFENLIGQLAIELNASKVSKDLADKTPNIQINKPSSR